MISAATVSVVFHFLMVDDDASKIERKLKTFPISSSLPHIMFECAKLFFD
jgi:hypothetical protein